MTGVESLLQARQAAERILGAAEWRDIPETIYGEDDGGNSVVVGTTTNRLRPFVQREDAELVARALLELTA